MRYRYRRLLLFSAGLGLEKPNSGLDPGETNSGSDLDSDETFQISRNVGLDIDEIVCLLDSQLWSRVTYKIRKMVFIFLSLHRGITCL